MDIEGFGERTVGLFLEHGLIHDVGDIYDDRLGRASVSSRASARSPSRNLPARDRGVEGRGRSPTCSSGSTSATSGRPVAAGAGPGTSATSTAIMRRRRGRDRRRRRRRPDHRRERCTSSSPTTGNRAVDREAAAAGRQLRPGPSEPTLPQTLDGQVDRRHRHARGLQPGGGRGGHQGRAAARRRAACRRRRPRSSSARRRAPPSSPRPRSSASPILDEAAFAQLLETGELPG